MQGYIHSIESMGLIDGPGIRSVVFFQGCKLRCKYCHNPDTWNKNNYSYILSPNELVQKLLRFKEYFGQDGGVTLSGGEPLLQIDFCIEVFKLLKQNGIHTCLDTSGVGNVQDAQYTQKVKELLKFTDLVLLDIKHYNANEYKALTGNDISDFNQFLSILQGSSVDVWIRHVIVPSLTDGELHINKLCEYVNTIKNIKKVELLPYHTMGEAKYEKLNIAYTLKGTVAPSLEQMKIYNHLVKDKVIQKEN